MARLPFSASSGFYALLVGSKVAIAFLLSRGCGVLSGR